MTKQLQPLIPFSRLSVLTMISFVRHMLLSLIKSHLFIFAPGFFFLFFLLRRQIQKNIATIYVEKYSAYVFSGSGHPRTCTCPPEDDPSSWV